MKKYMILACILVSGCAAKATHHSMDDFKTILKMDRVTAVSAMREDTDSERRESSSVIYARVAATKRALVPEKMPSEQDLVTIRAFYKLCAEGGTLAYSCCVAAREIVREQR